MKIKITMLGIGDIYNIKHANSNMLIEIPHRDTRFDDCHNSVSGHGCNGVNFAFENDSPVCNICENMARLAEYFEIPTKKYLVNCGVTCLQQLDKFGISIADIDGVIITDVTPDAIGGLELFGLYSYKRHNRRISKLILEDDTEKVVDTRPRLFVLSSLTQQLSDMYWGQTSSLYLLDDVSYYITKDKIWDRCVVRNGVKLAHDVSVSFTAANMSPFGCVANYCVFNIYNNPEIVYVINAPYTKTLELYEKSLAIFHSCVDYETPYIATPQDFDESESLPIYPIQLNHGFQVGGGCASPLSEGVTYEFSIS